MAQEKGLARVALIMGMLFIVAAAVQWNDPDPMRWIAFYLVAAGVTLILSFRPLPRWIPLIVAIVGVAWIASLAPAALRSGNPIGELAREFAGVAIVSAWMVVLAVQKPLG